MTATMKIARLKPGGRDHLTELLYAKIAVLEGSAL